MEYEEPLISCDKILGLLTCEGAQSAIEENSIYHKLSAGKQDPFIMQALRRMVDDNYLVKNGAYYSLSGTASQFINAGKYEGLCKRLKEKEANLTEKEKLEIKQIQSIIDTNTSVKNTNYWVKRTSIISSIIAFLTLMYIILQYYKDDKKIDLLPLQEQVKQSTLKLDSPHWRKGVGWAFSVGNPCVRQKTTSIKTYTGCIIVG